MNPKILQLSDSVINQIAAGEVVENPASIVKELIENSLDALSKRIVVDFSQGGFELIRVEDDGCGMSKEDAILSLKRHATSKIRAVEDLETLFTMGFRGEALAAISSVSQLELRTSDGTSSTKILASGGKIISVEPCARNRGTTIEVKNLFFNVPARKKFQKSLPANAAAINRIVEMLAIANEDVAIYLNGEEFAPMTRKERLEEILGPHEHEVIGSGLNGFVCSPLKAGTKRAAQYLFLNRRPIFSPLISKAVKAGFGTRIAEHEYPRFALFLDLNPSEVDVNVHPQKKEVRFKDEAKVFRLVEKAVEKAFSTKQSLPKEIVFTPTESSFSENFPKFPFRAEEIELDFDYRDRSLGVIGNYLLLQNGNLILVDLKAAHARILFETLKTEKASSQALVWPIEIQLQREDEEKAAHLSELGIEMRILNRLLVIDALPPFLEPDQFPEFFQSYMEEKKIERATARFCRASKKRYSFEEANALWHRLKKCSDSSYDPLGNPIFVELGEEHLAKLLKI